MKRCYSVDERHRQSASERSQIQKKDYGLHDSIYMKGPEGKYIDTERRLGVALGWDEKCE